MPDVGELTYCGCCGNEFRARTWDFCARCRKHIDPNDRPIWDRTYYAQFKRDCPFQVGAA